MKELVLTNELEGLEASKAQQIEAVFAPMVKMLKEFEGAYDEIVSQEVTEDLCKKAKRLRLDIAKIRTSADKERKAQKAEYLRAGNAIQGVYNILKFAVEEKEGKLKDIENHFDNLEKERIAKLQIEREEEIQKYEVEVIPQNLGAMEEEVWNNYLSGTKTNYEAIKEAERKAEEERLEQERIKKLQETRVFQCSRLVDFIENFESINFGLMSDKDYSVLVEEAKGKRTAYEQGQEKIRLENERLKKEQEEAEAERLRVEAENKAKLEKERKKAEAEKKKIQKANELKLKKEREEKERLQKLEADRLAKEEAEKKAKEEAERKAKLAPDKDKLKMLSSELRKFMVKMELSLDDKKANELLSGLYNDYETLVCNFEEDLKQL